MKTVHVVIEGRVQGVFFRDYTQKEATRLGLVGWVRNLPNGSVDAVVSGQEDVVDEMIEWFTLGSPLSRVERVTVDEIMLTDTFPDFSIHF